jgi:hypothetical protein
LIVSFFFYFFWGCSFGSKRSCVKKRNRNRHSSMFVC